MTYGVPPLSQLQDQQPSNGGVVVSLAQVVPPQINPIQQAHMIYQSRIAQVSKFAKNKFEITSISWDFSLIFISRESPNTLDWT